MLTWPRVARGAGSRPPEPQGGGRWLSPDPGPRVQKRPDTRRCAPGSPCSAGRPPPSLRALHPDVLGGAPFPGGFCPSVPMCAWPAAGGGKKQPEKGVRR